MKLIGRYLSLLLKTVYPNHNWLIWKFNYLPKGYWDNKDNEIEFMNWLGKKLEILFQQIYEDNLMSL